MQGGCPYVANPENSEVADLHVRIRCAGMYGDSIRVFSNIASVAGSSDGALKFLLVVAHGGYHHHPGRPWPAPVQSSGVLFPRALPLRMLARQATRNDQEKPSSEHEFIWRLLAGALGEGRGRRAKSCEVSGLLSVRWARPRPALARHFAGRRRWPCSSAGAGGKPLRFGRNSLCGNNESC
jgi:hypothetical protein